MGPVSATTTIDAPRERIAAVVADLAKRPALYGDAIDDFNLGRLKSTGVGAAARFGLAGGKGWYETRISEVNGSHSLRETGRTGRSGKVPTTMLWEFIEGPAGLETGVRVTFMTEPASAFHEMGAGAAARRWKRLLRHALERLRTIVEEDESITVAGVAGGQRIPG